MTDRTIRKNPHGTRTSGTRIDASAMSEAQLRQIGAGVHAWIGAGGDSNAGAIGEKFRDTLKFSFKGPFRTIVNTHYHLDHVAGNVAFAGAPIVAHEKTLRAIERETGAFSGEV